MDLETLVQRLDADTTQFNQALDQAQRDLTTTGKVSEDASRRIGAALEKIQPGIMARRMREAQIEYNNALVAAQLEMERTGRISEQTFRRVEQATVGLDRAARITQGSFGRLRGSFGTLRGAGQQLGFQLQDIIIQLQAGQSAAIIFAQQGSQIASIFGAWGAAAGVLIAVLGGLGGALLNMGSNADEATDALDDVLDVLKAIGEQDQALNRVISGLEDMSARARQFANLEARIQIPGLEEDLRAAREAVADELDGVIADIEERNQSLEAIGVGVPISEEQLERLRRLERDVRAGEADTLELVEALREVGEVAPDAFGAAGASALAAARDVETLTSALEAAQGIVDITGRRAGSGPPPLGRTGRARLGEGEEFGPPEPPGGRGRAPPRERRGEEFGPPEPPRIPVRSVRRATEGQVAGLGLVPTAEDFAQAATGAEALNEQLVQLDATAASVGAGLASIVTTAVFDGPQAAVQALIRSLVALALQAVFTAAAGAALRAAFGDPSGGAQASSTASATLAALTAFVGGGATPRQHGGPVRRGQVYRVGEDGEEYFVPGADGAIIPNTSNMLAPPSAAGIGGGGTSNNASIDFTVHAPGAQRGAGREILGVLRANRREIVEMIAPEFAARPNIRKAVTRRG